MRERNGDILEIAGRYIEHFNQKFHKDIRTISPAAADMLHNYYWKGNVRELRNVIERAMLVSTGDTILPEHLLLSQSTVAPPTADAPLPHLSEQIPLHDSAVEYRPYTLKIPPTGAKMDDVMKDLIEQTLKIANGNQLMAAKILGLTRAKFRYRLEQPASKFNRKRRRFLREPVRLVALHNTTCARKPKMLIRPA